MKGVPPELDALMWQLAEDGGPAAQDEFVLRHGRYAPELARRVRMVAELRQAGKTVVHRPTFVPRPARAATPRWAVGGTIGLAVVAVGAVAFVLASGKEVPRVTVAPLREAAPPPREEPVRVTPPQPLPIVPPKEERTPERTPQYTVPRDVRIADTSLTSAIMLVAAGGGLRATLAPGFKDQTVTLDYRGLTTLETLRAMGEQYGFSVLDEEEGHVLVVPARPTEEPARPLGP